MIKHIVGIVHQYVLQLAVLRVHVAVNSISPDSIVYSSPHLLPSLFRMSEIFIDESSSHVMVGGGNLGPN